MTRGSHGPRARLALVVVVLLLVGSGALASLPAAHAAPATSANYPPLTGNVTGPSMLAVNTPATYYELNGTGGPAFALNGTKIGNLTFYASVVAANTTSVSVSPTYAALPNASYPVSVSVGNVTEIVDLVVEFVSVYQTENVTLNVTYVIHVVQPYTLSGLIESGDASVVAFPITVTLDGTVVGSISIPAMIANSEYNFTFSYVALPLGPGSHTFVLTLPTQHGQVHFANGASSYSYTFYVPGPPPSYTLYYVLGIVAFIGVILIFLILVGGRRRGGSRS